VNHTEKEMGSREKGIERRGKQEVPPNRKGPGGMQIGGAGVKRQQILHRIHERETEGVDGTWWRNHRHA